MTVNLRSVRLHLRVRDLGKEPSRPLRCPSHRRGSGSSQKAAAGSWAPNRLSFLATIGKGMTVHLLLEASAPRRLPKCLAPIAALTLAAAVAGFVTVLPRTRSLSWAELISSAAVRVLAVLLAARVAVWMLYSTVDREQRADAGLVALRASAAALWLTPLALLIRENSPWAIAISAALACAAAQFFGQPRSFLTKGVWQSPVLCLKDYALGPPAASFDLRFPSIAAAALVVQVGVVVAFTGYSFTAALLVGIGFAFWMWVFKRESNAQTSHATEFNRLLFAMALSILFTAGGLIGYLRQAPRLHGYGIASLIHGIHRVPQRQGHPEGSAHASEGPATGHAEGSPGIILWPEKLVRTKLVAPSAVLGNGWLNGSRSPKPLVIPFNGVYWFFKAPDIRPPRSSRQAHGSPEVLNIRSTDFRPLLMEAHQNLGSEIDSDCCGKIQIAIRNADRYSGTVSLELVLINSSVPGRPTASLGSVVVESSQPWGIYETQRLRRETLNFMIPANLPIRRFDELKVVFRLDSSRADYGARIAIDRFVLVPRGL